MTPSSEPSDLVIEGGRVVVGGGRVIDPGRVTVQGGTVTGVEPASALPQPVAATVIDARGLLVTPGLVDLHVHGAEGADVMEATPSAFDRMARFLARHGVTSFLLTTVSAGEADVSAVIDIAGRFTPPADGAAALGVHLEGPYLSAERRGAHALEHLRSPVPEEYDAWLLSGVVKRITLAPELPGALDLVTAATAAGVRTSAGHTAADAAVARHAVDLGLRQATHLYNGMDPAHHRYPGVVGTVLTDERVRVELIADGAHVADEMLRLAVRAKGVDGIMLVSDGIRATGLEDGRYEANDAYIDVVDGVARTPAGGLAGSTLTMNQAVRRLAAATGLEPERAVVTATESPARAQGLEGRKGVLAPGADADIAAFGTDMRCALTVRGGRVVFEDTAAAS